MCLIIYIPPNTQPPAPAIFHSAALANPDGWGLMFARDGCLYTKRSLQPFKHPQALDSDWPAVWHFRTASSSTVSLSQTHPLRVSDTAALCHNGNLYEFSDQFATGPLPGDTRSDTQRFIERILRRLPPFTAWPFATAALVDHYFSQNLSKGVLMDNQGNVRIINERAGYWQDGCWFSNGGLTDYSGYGFSGVHYYHPGSVRHPGGLTSVAMFPDHRQPEWYRCRVCLGWHHESRESQAADTCPNCKVYLDLMEVAYSCSTTMTCSTHP